MGKNKKIFLTLFVAAFCIIRLIPILGFLSRVELGVPVMETPEPLEVRLSDLASRYKNGDISVIEMSAITSFAWDRLYFFGNYSSPETLDEAVGESWRNVAICEDKGTLLETSDSYTLLVFVKDNSVVHCLAHPHRPFPFGLAWPEDGRLGFSPQEALFVVNDFDVIVLKDEK